MSERPPAGDLERDAAARVPPAERLGAPASEPLAMLLRRGFSPSLAALDLPFPAELPEADAARLADALDHYGFRLLLRGVIQRRDGVLPGEATRFLTPAHAAELAELLRSLGLVDRLADGRVCLRKPAASFGGTLEWYVTRQLRARYGLDAIAGVNFDATGIGGNLDVVAATEGKLVVLELKSSPPKHLGEDEVNAFFDRVGALRPHVAILAIDTALRLGDKVIPLLAATLAARRTGPVPRRIERDLWALSPHLFVVNAKPDLIANIGRALAEGLRALAPEPF